MSFVTTSTVVSPIIGILVAVVVVTVIVVVIASAVRGGEGSRAGAVAYFLFGLSLVTLGTAVATTGIVTHSVSELVGPTPQTFDTPYPDCSSSSSSNSTDSASTAPSSTTSTTLAENNSSGLNAFCQSISSGNGQALFANGSAVTPNNSFTSFTTDDTNHYISLSVLTGLFFLTAAIAYFFSWRRARRMVREVGLGQAPLGRLPVTYSYLIAGLAVLSLLVFLPLTADNIFRAIAPGVNETSGHADGLRNLVTFLVLSGLSAGILRYHLGYLAALHRDATPISTEPTPQQPDPGAFS